MQEITSQRNCAAIVAGAVETSLVRVWMLKNWRKAEDGACAHRPITRWLAIALALV